MQVVYDNINNYTNHEYKVMFNSLNDLDKSKINKLIKANDKKLSILAKYLLKSILSQKYHLDYNNIYFNKNGKPLIEGIYFNISHSNDYVILAFSQKMIGIDIEKIRKVNLSIMNRFCTGEEKDYILKSKNKYKSLFEIYTLKEAYFKMLGTDLSNIKSVNFVKSNSIITNNNIVLDYSIDNYVIAIIKETGN